MRDYVLYHAHCPDGFGAAWAAWKRLGDVATYVAVRHGVPPPDMPDCERLFLVDFAYPAQQLAQLRERVLHITILDHHKSAQAALTGIGESPPRFEPDPGPSGLICDLRYGRVRSNVGLAVFPSGHGLSRALALY